MLTTVAPRLLANSGHRTHVKTDPQRLPRCPGLPLSLFTVQRLRSSSRALQSCKGIRSYREPGLSREFVEAELLIMPVPLERVRRNSPVHEVAERSV
jgi:hypothetical protein